MPTLTFKNENDEHVYELDGVVVPSVTQVLQGVGLINFDGVPAAALEYARNRGSLVHQALEFYDQDDLDVYSLDPAIASYLPGYQRYLIDSGFIPETIEQRVYHEQYRYAGTLDRTGTMGGKRVLIDLKTGAVDKWVALQTAAYEMCLPDGYERYALQLTAEGKYKLTKFSDHRDRQVWLSALALFNWKGQK